MSPAPFRPMPGWRPGASETCTADNPYTVIQSDVDAGGVTDSATATGVDTQGAQSEPSSASTVTVPAVAAAPSVSLTKTATVDPATDQNAVQVGDRISYSYKVTNTGNVTLTSVAVSDPSAGNVTCPTPAGARASPRAEPVTCTADDPHPVTQVDIDNGGVTDTATATGTDTQGDPEPGLYAGDRQRPRDSRLCRLSRFRSSPMPPTATRARSLPGSRSSTRIWSRTPATSI